MFFRCVCISFIKKENIFVHFRFKKTLFIPNRFLTLGNVARSASRIANRINARMRKIVVFVKYPMSSVPRQHQWLKFLAVWAIRVGPKFHVDPGFRCEPNQHLSSRAWTFLDWSHSRDSLYCWSAQKHKVRGWILGSVTKISRCRGTLNTFQAYMFRIPGSFLCTAYIIQTRTLFEHLRKVVYGLRKMQGLPSPFCLFRITESVHASETGTT